MKTRVVRVVCLPEGGSREQGSTLSGKMVRWGEGQTDNLQTEPLSKISCMPRKYVWNFTSSRPSPVKKTRTPYNASPMRCCGVRRARANGKSVAWKEPIRNNH